MSFARRVYEWLTGPKKDASVTFLSQKASERHEQQYRELMEEIKRVQDTLAKGAGVANAKRH